mmetsp:Transcript_43797/g.88309  ORF Transcript_43797/g.88309 Transcript_43797/m.88309 type:complete len:243 (-) Transcript_43797:205-933(-)
MHDRCRVTRLCGRYRSSTGAHRIRDTLRSLSDPSVICASVEQYYVASFCGEVEVDRRPKFIGWITREFVEAGAVELVFEARALVLPSVALLLYFRPMPVAPVVEAHGHWRVRDGQPHRDQVRMMRWLHWIIVTMNISCVVFPPGADGTRCFNPNLRIGRHDGLTIKDGACNANEWRVSEQYTNRSVHVPHGWKIGPMDLVFRKHRLQLRQELSIVYHFGYHHCAISSKYSLLLCSGNDSRQS